MNPQTTATARPDLADAFHEMRHDSLQAGFVGERVMPYFDTPKQAGGFKKVTIKSLLSSMNTDRTSGGGYNRQKWDFTQDAYATTEHGAEEPIDDRDAENYGDYFEIEVISTGRARYAVMLGHEQRVRDALRSAAGTAAGSDWSDAANATPLDDVEAAVRTLRSRGVHGNQLVIPWTDFRNLRLCEQIADKLASQGAGRTIEPAKISAADLASLFDIDEVVVAGGIYNAANPGQDVSISDIWSSGTATLHAVPRTRDLSEPCSGRTFHWTGDGSEEGGKVETYRDETVRGNVVRVRNETQEKVLFEEAIQNITGLAG